MSTAEERREADQIEGVLPPEFAARVVGHGEVRTRLERQVAGARVPGAILLHGPRGIGKATLAFDVARRLLVATGDEDEPRVREQIAAGSHPNVFVLRRQPRETGKGYYTAIRVDEVRELRERMRRTRGRAGHRVAIVDAIDDCNPQAANALLKTLEEPPPETLFLLVSHRPGGLLPTIRSRCQSMALRQQSEDDVREVLALQRPEAELEPAVSLAGGRPRRGFEALLMSDQSMVMGLQKWLLDPSRHPPAMHIMLADGLAASRDGPEMAFAREIVGDWVAEEARHAAIAGERRRLVSANELWEKASAQFDDADEYNLDARQTLVGIFDAIRRHSQLHVLSAERQ